MKRILFLLLLSSSVLFGYSQTDNVRRAKTTNVVKKTNSAKTVKTTKPTMSPQNKAKAEALYKQGNEAFGKKDYQEAFRLYSECSKLGYPDGTSSLAYCYQEGYGTEKNHQKAYELYVKANDTFNIGFCYLKGIGVQADQNKAKELFSKAEKEGKLTPKQWGDVYSFLIKDKYKANDYYRIAARNGDIYSMERLGERLSFSEKDNTEGYEWYKKAADLGSVKGTYGVGCCFLYGNGGMTQNEEKAMEWFRKGSKMGDANSTDQLYCYYSNSGQYKQAFEYAKLLYEQDKSGANRLIDCLYQGKGTEKDYNRAFILAKELAEKHGKYHQLAEFYEKGIGTPKNIQEAAKCYKALNSDWGNEQAKRLGY